MDPWRPDEQLQPTALCARKSSVTRALASIANGAQEQEIAARFEELPLIEGATELYVHIHREGPAHGVENVSDLIDRVISPEEGRRLGVGCCRTWFDEHGGSGPTSWRI